MRYWCFVLAALVLVPAGADAQIVVGSRWGGYGGPGYGGPGFGGPGFGGPGYGWGTAFANPGFAYGRYGWGGWGGWGTGYHGIYGVSWASRGAFDQTGSAPALLIISDPPRARIAFQPAITLPPADVIAAALEGADDLRARLEIYVPAEGAQAYIDDVVTRQTGTRRQFVTPPLEAGKTYSLKVRAVWTDEKGQRQDVTRVLEIRAGESRRADFRGKTR